MEREAGWISEDVWSGTERQGRGRDGGVPTTTFLTSGQGQAETRVGREMKRHLGLRGGRGATLLKMEPSQRVWCMRKTILSG